MQVFERLEQHLALAAADDSEQAGVQREFGARQEQCEGVMVGLKLGACARGNQQARRIGGDRQQPLPGKALPVGFGERHEVRVGSAEERCGEPLSCLAEGLRGDLSNAVTCKAKGRKEAAEFGSDAGADAGEHQSGHARQGETALTGKGRVAEPEALGKSGALRNWAIEFSGCSDSGRPRYCCFESLG